MVIQDLSSWAPPDGLGKSLTSSDVKYDLVHGPEFVEPILEHLQRSARSDLVDVYQMGIESKESGSIIRAKRAQDGLVMGTLLCYKADSKLASFMPGFGKNVSEGFVSSPVISPAASDRQSMLQGLVLLAVRQLKRQGMRSVVFDYVSVSLKRRLQADRF